jgi:hypothetical protein
MNVHEFKLALQQNERAVLQFVLPGGERIPAHFHVTEVGRIDRSFIDCGGTKRRTAACMLQIWTANDLDHRLVPGKLSGIMDLAESVLQSDDIPVEVEYGVNVAGQYTIDHYEALFGTLTFVLAGKQTDCLAKDKCGVEGCNTQGCCESESTTRCC